MELNIDDIFIIIFEKKKKNNLIILRIACQFYLRSKYLSFPFIFFCFVVVNFFKSLFPIIKKKIVIFLFFKIKIV